MYIGVVDLPTVVLTVLRYTLLARGRFADVHLVCIFTSIPTSHHYRNAKSLTRPRLRNR